MTQHALDLSARPAVPGPAAPLPGTVRVVKLGGRAQADPALAEALAAIWRSAPGALVVVHGGGDDVSALQRRMGHEPTFLGGRRVTGEGDIDLLRMALSGLANKRLVSALVARGAHALGLSGEDAGLLSAEPAETPELGCVGRPTAVNTRLLAYLLAAGYLPVVSPLAAKACGAAGALNVNGDDAAAAIAGALGAEELLFVSDVPGVLLAGAPVASLDVEEAAAAVAAGTAGGGMVPKLGAAALALALGVRRVRIGDLAALHDPERGTAVTQRQPLSASVSAWSSTP
jgi:acetylglutamate kinase